MYSNSDPSPARVAQPQPRNYSPYFSFTTTAGPSTFLNVHRSRADDTVDGGATAGGGGATPRGGRPVAPSPLQPHLAAAYVQQQHQQQQLLQEEAIVGVAMDFSRPHSPIATAQRNKSGYAAPSLPSLTPAALLSASSTADRSGSSSGASPIVVTNHSPMFGAVNVSAFGSNPSSLGGTLSGQPNVGPQRAVIPNGGFIAGGPLNASVTLRHTSVNGSSSADSGVRQYLRGGGGPSPMRVLEPIGASSPHHQHHHPHSSEPSSSGSPRGASAAAMAANRGGDQNMYSSAPLDPLATLLMGSLGTSASGLSGATAAAQQQQSASLGGYYHSSPTSGDHHFSHAHNGSSSVSSPGGGAAQSPAAVAAAVADHRFKTAIWTPQLTVAAASYHQLERARAEAIGAWTPATVAAQLNNCRAFHGLSMLVDAKVVHAYANYCEEVRLRQDSEARRLLEQYHGAGYYYSNGEHTYAAAPRTAEEEAERGNTTTLGVLQRDLAALRFVTENTKSMHDAAEGEVAAARAAAAKERERLEARGVPTEVFPLRAGPPFYHKTPGAPERLVQRLSFGEALFLNNVDGGRLLALTEESLVAHFGLSETVARVAVRSIAALRSPSAVEERPLPSTLKELLEDQQWDLRLAAAAGGDDKGLFYLHTTSMSTERNGVGGDIVSRTASSRGANSKLHSAASSPRHNHTNNATTTLVTTPLNSNIHVAAVPAGMARRASTSYYSQSNTVVSVGGSSASPRSPMSNRLPSGRRPNPLAESSTMVSASGRALGASAATIGDYDANVFLEAEAAAAAEAEEEDRALRAAQHQQFSARQRVGDGVDTTNEEFKKWSNLSRAGQLRRMAEEREKVLKEKQREADAVAKATEVDPSHLTPMELLRVAGGVAGSSPSPAEGRKVGRFNQQQRQRRLSSAAGDDRLFLFGDDDNGDGAAALVAADEEIATPARLLGSAKATSALDRQIRAIGLLERERRSTVLKELYGTIKGYFTLQEALAVAGAAAEEALRVADAAAAAGSHYQQPPAMDSHRSVSPFSVLNSPAGPQRAAAPPFAFAGTQQSDEASGAVFPLFGGTSPPNSSAAVPSTAAHHQIAANAGADGIVRPHTAQHMTKPRSSLVGSATAQPPRPNSALQRIARVTFQNDAANRKYAVPAPITTSNATSSMPPLLPMPAFGGDDGQGQGQPFLSSRNGSIGGGGAAEVEAEQPASHRTANAAAAAFAGFNTSITSASAAFSLNPTGAFTTAQNTNSASAAAAAMAAPSSPFVSREAEQTTPLTLKWLVLNCVQPILRLTPDAAESLTHRLSRTLQQEYVLLERAEALVALEAKVKGPRAEMAAMMTHGMHNYGGDHKGGSKNGTSGGFSAGRLGVLQDTVRAAEREFRAHIRALQGEEDVAATVAAVEAKELKAARNSRGGFGNTIDGLRRHRTALATSETRGGAIIPVAIEQLAQKKLSSQQLRPASADAAEAEANDGEGEEDAAADKRSGLNDSPRRYLSSPRGGGSPRRGVDNRDDPTTPSSSPKKDDNAERASSPHHSTSMHSRSSPIRLASSREASPTRRGEGGRPRNHRLLSSPLYRAGSHSAKAQRELAIVILHAHHALQKVKAMRSRPELLAPSYSTGFRSAFGAEAEDRGGGDGGLWGGPAASSSGGLGGVGSTRARRGSLFGSPTRQLGAAASPSPLQSPTNRSRRHRSASPTSARSSSPLGLTAASLFSTTNGSSTASPSKRGSGIFFAGGGMGNSGGGSRPMSPARRVKEVEREKARVERMVLAGAYSFEADFRLSAEAFAFVTLEATVQVSDKAFDFIVEFISDRFGAARVEELRRRSVISDVFADACDAFRPEASDSDEGDEDEDEEAEVAPEADAVPAAPVSVEDRREADSAAAAAIDDAGQPSGGSEQVAYAHQPPPQEADVDAGEGIEEDDGDGEQLASAPCVVEGMAAAVPSPTINNSGRPPSAPLSSRQRQQRAATSASQTPTMDSADALPPRRPSSAASVRSVASTSPATADPNLNASKAKAKKKKKRAKKKGGEEYPAHVYTHLLARRSLAQIVNSFLQLEHRSTSAAASRLRDLSAAPQLHSTTNHTSRLNASERAAMFIAQDAADDCFLFTLNLATRNRLMRSQQQQQKQQQFVGGEAAPSSPKRGGDESASSPSAAAGSAASLLLSRSRTAGGEATPLSPERSRRGTAAMAPASPEEGEGSGIAARRRDRSASRDSGDGIATSSSSAAAKSPPFGASEDPQLLLAASASKSNGSNNGGATSPTPTRLQQRRRSNSVHTSTSAGGLIGLGAKKSSDLSANVPRIASPIALRIGATTATAASAAAICENTANNAACDTANGSVCGPLSNDTVVTTAVGAASPIHGRSVVVMPALITRDTFVKFVADEWLALKAEAFDHRILLLRTCVMARRMERDRSRHNAARQRLLADEAAEAEALRKREEEAEALMAKALAAMSSEVAVPTVSIDLDVVVARSHAAKTDASAATATAEDHASSSSPTDSQEGLPVATVTVTLSPAEAVLAAAADVEAELNASDAAAQRPPRPSSAATARRQQQQLQWSLAGSPAVTARSDLNAASASSNSALIADAFSSASSPRSPSSTARGRGQQKAPPAYITQEGFETLCASSVTDATNRPIVLLLAPEVRERPDGTVERFSIYPAVLVEQFFWNARSPLLRRQHPSRYANGSVPALKQQQPHLYSISSEKALRDALAAMGERGGMSRGHWYYVEFAAEGMNRHPLLGEERTRRGAQWPPAEGDDLAGTRSVIIPSPARTARRVAGGGDSAAAETEGRRGGEGNQCDATMIGSECFDLGAYSAEIREDNGGASAVFGSPTASARAPFSRGRSSSPSGSSSSSSAADDGRRRSSSAASSHHNPYDDDDYLAAGVCGGLLESFLRELSGLIMRQRRGGVHPSFRVFVRYPSLKLSPVTFPTIAHRTCNVIDLVNSEAVVKFD